MLIHDISLGLTMRVWLSRATTSPLRAPRPTMGPSTTGPGTFSLAEADTSTRPIIFCNS